MNKLRVLARGDCLILDAAYSQATGRRRYIGRTEVAAWKEEDLPADAPKFVADNSFLSPGDKPIPHFAYPKNGLVADVPNDAQFGSYFRKAVKTGGLWPADLDTAKECGVKFDPTFGGEYPAEGKE